ncbi:MAG: hypothetical protein LBG52_02510 [Candidatus Peribacteria bacterium]|jgi:hypothetical protein|nr:hypothetical protein [Candidatus Peribacteria bacterium]
MTDDLGKNLSLDWTLSSDGAENLEEEVFNETPPSSGDTNSEAEIRDVLNLPNISSNEKLPEMDEKEIAGMLGLLLFNWRGKARIAIAENPKTPSSILARLAHTGGRKVRKGVARNPSTSPDTLALLADDEESEVIEEVARNPKTPLEILEDFAVDWTEDMENLIEKNLEQRFQN